MRARAVSLVCFIPTTFSAPPKTIRIGVIAPSDDEFNSVSTTYKQIVEPDINDYVAKLPRDRFQPQVKFEFLIESAQASAQVHLQKVQKFHKMGVDLIIGGAWSSQAAASLSYVNEHGMVLVSYSSTSPLLAIPGDNLFRLCPDDVKQGKAIAEMVLSKGVTRAIIIQRDDVWIYNIFESEYVAGGGVILTRQSYPTDTSDFTAYLEAAEAEATGAPDEGVLIISFEGDAAALITQAQGYPIIYDLPWFGSDGTALSSWILSEATEQACHLKIYSTVGGGHKLAEVC